MENHEYSDIVGSSAAPYINKTLIPNGLLFTNYDAVSHPSLPNYLAMTSGSTNGKAGTDDITSGEMGVDNLFHQLSAAGESWNAFEESMPSLCYSGSTAPDPTNGPYALKHDPAMAYADIATSSWCSRVVPYSQIDPSNLPSFAFVTPSICNDMHGSPTIGGDCAPNSPALITRGDEWLYKTIPPLVAAGATVIVTFDEGRTHEGGGGRVVTVEIGPLTTPGTTSSTSYDHFGLLAGLETHYGLPLLQNAKAATPLPT